MIPQQHGAFPTAQTCGNKLCLPDYETPEVPPTGLTLTLTLNPHPHPHPHPPPHPGPNPNPNPNTPEALRTGLAEAFANADYGGLHEVGGLH